MPRLSLSLKSVRRGGGKLRRKRRSQGSTRAKLSILSKRRVRSVGSASRRKSRNVRDVKKGGRLEVGSIVEAWLNVDANDHYQWIEGRVEAVEPAGNDTYFSTYYLSAKSDFPEYIHNKYKIKEYSDYEVMKEHFHERGLSYKRCIKVDLRHTKQDIHCTPDNNELSPHKPGTTVLLPTIIEKHASNLRPHEGTATQWNQPALYDTSMWPNQP